jgi:flagellar hook-associated protein 1 FlgK
VNEELGSDASELPFWDKLQQGSLSFSLYQQSTGDLVGQREIQFDPDTESLSDLQGKLDGMWTEVQASTPNNHLQISTNTGYAMAIGHDSTGALAALGVNTYFQGTGADDIAVNSEVNTNLKRINAAHVNGAGEVNPGDNTTARRIAGLQSSEVDLETSFEGETTQTLQEFFNSLTANVGEDTAQAEYSRDFAKTLADDLNERQKSVSGVNLDEEMSNLIKYQHSYTAAAKLITTAEQMMNTLLSMKQ